MAGRRLSFTLSLKSYHIWFIMEEYLTINCRVNKLKWKFTKCFWYFFRWWKFFYFLEYSFILCSEATRNFSLSSLRFLWFPPEIPLFSPCLSRGQTAVWPLLKQGWFRGETEICQGWTESSDSGCRFVHTTFFPGAAQKVNSISNRVFRLHKWFLIGNPFPGTHPYCSRKQWFHCPKM